MRLIKTLIPALSVLSLALAPLACSSDDDATTGDGDGGAGGETPGDGDGDGDGDAPGGMGGGGKDCSTILEAAAATPELSSLVAAIEAAGIGAALEGEDLTVFAPTNDAFAALLTALDLEFSDLTADNLIPILTYHVADSVVDSSAAIGVAGSEDNTFGTLGGTITLDVVNGELVIDQDEFSATVVTPDIMACNGIVHVIDGVIVPSIADIVTTQEGFSGLATLIGAAESGATIAAALDSAAEAGAYTLFAPDNDAISAVDPVPSPAVLDDILQYHVYAAESAVTAATALTLDDAAITMLNGDEVTVNGGSAVSVTDTGGATSTVTIADIYAANGIIHVVDGVLLPESITE